MRRHLIGVAELAVLATLGAVFVAARTGVPSQDLWRGYLLLMCSLGAWLLVQALSHSGDPRPSRSRAPGRRGSGIPAELTGVGDLLQAGAASRAEFDRGMRPLLREIAQDRLLLLGVDADRQPDQAATLLGPRLTELALTRGASLAEIRDRGPSPAEVAQFLDRLEALAR
ncbi:MAG: hypothetical protein ACYDHB_08225 [Candidatus Dormibacteria bacterium]